MLAAELKIHIVKEIAELSDEQFMKVYDELIKLLHPPVRKPQFGSAKELITFVSADFDAPLDDFKDYMP